MSGPDDLVDEHGGVRVPYTQAEIHKCFLPEANSTFVRAYKTGCCNQWHRRRFVNADFASYWSWTLMFKWRVRLWQRKGWLPRG